MTDLRNVVADFQKTSAYAVLDDLVRVCGIDSVLGALSEITAAQQSVHLTGYQPREKGDSELYPPSGGSNVSKPASG